MYAILDISHLESWNPVEKQQPALRLSQAELPPRLDRVLLEDRVTELLRDYIVQGRFRPGAKLVEHEIAQWFGVSRMPVRHALVRLEKEGLVISRPDARYVIDLTEQDIRYLCDIRMALEKVAAERAAENITPERRIALRATQKSSLQQMKEALKEENTLVYYRSGLEIHELIWAQAGNPYLTAKLKETVNLLFMWAAICLGPPHMVIRPKDPHEELISAICSGEPTAARESIERHLEGTLHDWLNALRGDRLDAKPEG